MGILDFLNPQDPMKQQSLLAAAAAMLQGAGDTRHPFGLGQAAAAGVGTYQQSMQQQQQLAQQQAVRDLQLKSAQNELDDHDLARQHAAGLQDVYSNFTQGGTPAAAPATPFPKPQSAAGLMGGLIAGQGLPADQPAPTQAPQAMAATDRNSIAQQHLLLAKALRAKGYGKEAQAEEDTAFKLQPKYSTDFRTATGADGQLHNYMLADDGSWKDTGLGVKPDMTEVDLGGTKQFVDKNSMQSGKSFAKTMTPDGVAADRRAAAQLSFQKSQVEGNDEVPISDDAIKNAAARYNIDGTLPPMGMGKAAAAGRSAILNEAARQKAGISGEQQRLDQLNNKGDVAARNAAVRSFATGKDGQIVQSANTALNHLDTIRELALAQKNGDWKAFNVAANRFASATGNPAPTNLRSALMMVGPEVAKAVGAAGTGHERDQAQQALNPDGSVDQILGGVQTMQELFGGRLSETKRTYERVTKNKDFSTFLSPAAQSILDQRTQRASAGAAPAAAGVKFLGFE